MSISAISGSTSSIYQTGAMSGVNPVSCKGKDSDGDQGRVSHGRVMEGAQFISTILQSLAQAGVSGPATTAAAASTDTTANGSGTSPQETLKALGSFIQDLLAALKSQGGAGGSPGSGTGDPQSQVAQGVAGVGSAAGTPGMHGHHHHDGLGQIEAGLQSLIAQLSSGTGGQSGATSPAAATDGTVAQATASQGAGSSTAMSVLQQSYQGLLGALGAAGGSTSLGGFLQVLAQNMQGLSATGNIVNTHA